MTVSIVKPTVGGDSGTWGQELNTALDVIVAALNAVQGQAALGIPIRSTPPDHNVTPVYADSSTVPPTLKGWNGTAWVQIGTVTSGGGTGGGTGGGGGAAAFAPVDNGTGSTTLTPTGGATAVDNGNGTVTLTGGSAVDNGNGLVTIAA